MLKCIYLLLPMSRVSLEYKSRSELNSCRTHEFSDSWSNAKSFQSYCLNLHSCQQWMRMLASHYPCKHSISTSFYIFTSLVIVKWYPITVLVCIFLTVLYVFMGHFDGFFKLNIYLWLLPIKKILLFAIL